MGSSTWTDAQALAYIASYADLRLALGANPEAGRRHYAQAGAAEGRRITFDPYGYLATYADLRAALGSDATAAARHYLQWGATEGRSVTFDAYGYLASYADLRAALGSDVAAATRHYVQWGAAEERSVTFDAIGYLASYADLRAALGTDTAEATRHYVQWGAAEGRAVTFDAYGYLASYSDLRASFGANTAAATRHYVTTGASEGRVVTFDAVTYLLSQPDLPAAGWNAASAARHYVTWGASEGRSATGSFGSEQSDHALPFGRTIASTIDAPGDRDWYSVNLSAGQGATFSLLASNGNGSVQIYDANGRAQAVSVSGARTSFAPSTGGTYYVVVSTANNATGQYALLAENQFTIVGTYNADTLTGTDGADLIQGLDGGDTLNGRGGNDVLEGGAGYDQLDGGLGDDVLYGNNAANTGFDGADVLQDSQGGNDQLFGQDGNDYLSVSRYSVNGQAAASTVLLDGGTGDDTISFYANSRFVDTVTIRGGTGNDTIAVGSVLRSVVDAGDGNDKVTIDMTGGNQTITLGAGADILSLSGNAYAIAVGNPTRITDFATGTDTLNIDEYLAATLTNWDKTTNPFATGHLKLVQSGSDTLLQLDRDGASGTGYSLATLLTFANTNAAAFTAKDLGYVPNKGSTDAVIQLSDFSELDSSAFSAMAKTPDIHFVESGAMALDVHIAIIA